MLQNTRRKRQAQHECAFERCERGAAAVCHARSASPGRTYDVLVQSGELDCRHVGWCGLAGRACSHQT